MEEGDPNAPSLQSGIRAMKSNYANVLFGSIQTDRWKTLVYAVLLVPVALGAQADTLYVSANPGIDEVTASGNVSTFYSSPYFLTGLAFDTSGNLFVAGDEGSDIGKISPSGNRTTFATGLIPNDFEGLAFDPSGSLYATDDGNILKFTANGSYTTLGTSPLSYGLTFDKGGDLFVAGQNGSQIIEHSPTGASSIFASGGTAFNDLAFDSSGNLFVTDFSGYVYKFTPAGVESVFASGLSGPYGLAFDSSGNLFVSEYQGNDIIEFTPSGQESTFATGLINPRFIAIEPVPEPSIWLLITLGMATRRLVERSSGRHAPS
jgi:hypothetical protein